MGFPSYPAVRPKKKFSQNFLINKGLARKLTGHILKDPCNTVLEIGPGRGALTRELIKSRKQVTAVEIDPEAVEYLRAELGDARNLEVVRGDLLTQDIRKLAGTREKLCVAGNLPYHLTSRILLYLLGFQDRISSCYVMVQKEVGRRITAKPGTGDFSFLSAILQTFCSVRPLASVKAGSFRPVPGVDSMFLKIDFKSPPPLSNKEISGYKAFLTLAFSHRRKYVIKNLGHKYDPEKISRLLMRHQVSLTARAQDLSPQTYVTLFQGCCNDC
jgi:16S rRNA (adenine1518-N6/adenine1519-N6)-dimethyltransferase